jgi:hypothetical protein
MAENVAESSRRPAERGQDPKRAFDPEELRARVKVGERVLNLQAAQAAQFAALEDALARKSSSGRCSQFVQAVSGFVPTGNTGTMDLYVHMHARPQGSPHGICPAASRRSSLPIFS